MGGGGQNHQPHQKAKYPKTRAGGDDRKLAKIPNKECAGDMCVCVGGGGGGGRQRGRGQL